MYFASMLPVRALVSNFPVREVKKLAVFSILGKETFARDYTTLSRENPTATFSSEKPGFSLAPEGF